MSLLSVEVPTFLVPTSSNDVEVDDKLTFTSEDGDTICVFSSTNINTGYYC